MARRSRAFLVTAMCCRPRWAACSVPTRTGQTTWAFDFSREGARASFESSLERLGIERVDIVFVHDPDEHYEAALAGAFPVLRELRARGGSGPSAPA